jgi:hypothetical protein
MNTIRNLALVVALAFTAGTATTANAALSAARATSSKNLGPVKLISDEDIAALGQFADALDEVQRQAQVATAPTLGFWGRVLKRGNEMVSSGSETFALTRATIAELFDEGPNKTSALTPQEIAAARESLSPYVPSVQTATETKSATAREAARSRMNRPDTGNLSRIGGLYFGADYNLRLMTLQQETKRFAERTAIATEKSAEKLSE